MSEAEIAEAYRLIAGPDSSETEWRTLSSTRLRSMYRQRSLETHPDRALVLGIDDASCEECQKAINRAYQLLLGVVRSPRRCAARGNWVTSSHRWRGRVPERSLAFGEFLYYAHGLPWSVLVDALAWQKRQRPMLGELGRAHGLLDSFAICHINRVRRRHEKFGDCAQRLGYLTTGELHSLLTNQFSQQKPLGAYFVIRGHFTSNAVEEFARSQRQHNARVEQSA